MARITLENLSKRFASGHHAVRALDLEVADGELLVLVGPSGSGKSTVLRMIAGLEEPTGGRIRIGDRDVTGLPPQRRDLAMVFQSYALYPHMSVRENLGFGLRMRKTPAPETARRVDDVARALGLEPLLERRPAQLSGGQRQRVALGRAIVREPLAFLLDEPLSNLDAKLRVATRAELARLHRRLGATMVYVTHDQTEAMTLGDRVAVLRDGELQQVAPPMELYRRPTNRFVAEFIGSPGMNILEGEIADEGGRALFRGAGVRLPLDGVRTDAALPAAGTPVLLGVRPHELLVRPVPEGAGATPEDTAPHAGTTAFSAEVGVLEPLGNEQVVHLTTRAGAPVLAVVPPDLALRPDQSVEVRVPPLSVHLFAGEGERRV